jgi:hypothetical protein
VDYLFRGDVKTQEMDDAAKAFGVTLLEPEQPQHYELWAEHAPALDLFLRVWTQRHFKGEEFVGFNYVAVLQLAHLYQVADLPTVMEDLQVMELHAVAKMNARLTTPRKH